MSNIVLGSLTAVATRRGAPLAEVLMDVDAILIVDVSGSMETRDAPGGQSRYRAAVSELTHLQEMHPGRLAVVAFSDRVTLCPGGVPPIMGANTDLVSALQFVKPFDDTGVQFILISDGLPDDPRRALEVARTFRSKIDVIYVGPEGGPDARGRRFLEDLARATGGHYVESEQPGLLACEVEQLLLPGR